MSIQANTKFCGIRTLHSDASVNYQVYYDNKLSIE